MVGLADNLQVKGRVEARLIVLSHKFKAFFGVVAVPTSFVWLSCSLIEALNQDETNIFSQDQKKARVILDMCTIETQMQTIGQLNIESNKSYSST